MLRLIPTTPAWAPSVVAHRRAETVFRELVPNAQSVGTRTYSEVTFVDCGANFGAIFCPSCGGELALRWWQTAMDVAFATRFERLDVVTPCCGATTSLNDLAYAWPVGFARWELVAENPGRAALDTVEMAKVEAVLEHGLRQVWQHL
jgi:hypothetical protein